MMLSQVGIIWSMFVSKLSDDANIKHDELTVRAKVHQSLKPLLLSDSNCSIASACRVQEFGVPFMETSARSGLNVELAFTALAK